MSETIRHFHLFCGIGGGAAGGRHLEVSVQGLRGRFKCLGGVDVDPGAVEAFSRYVGAPGTALDLFSAEQFAAFHGRAPKHPWREATPQDLRDAAGGEHPDILVTSPPCKGFSGLVSETRATSPKYAALNALTVRGIDLALRAWEDDPPAFWLLENVPRLVNRGEDLLAQIIAMLEGAGYSVAYTIPDLGALGGLAQTRKRFHLVARHREKCPVHVFEPPTQRLRSIGEVLGKLPRPEDPAAGLLHRLPRLEWRTWVRLALIRAGGDWRGLRGLAVENGHLRDFALAPGASGRHDNGPWSIADPRTDLGESTHSSIYRVTPWGRTGRCVTSSSRPASGGGVIADPRPPLGWEGGGKYRVTGLQETAGTVIAESATGNGAYAIADPHLDWHQGASSSKLRVSPWPDSARCVTGSDRVGSGAPSVADPREVEALAVDERSPLTLPLPGDRGLWVIQALDGTWHRPMSVLERAALQGLVDVDSIDEFSAAVAGATVSRVSEWVGNAIPPPSMAASLRAAGVAILLSRAGETFALSNAPVWVKPLARAVLLGAPGGIA